MILVEPQTEFLGEVPLTLDEQLKFIERSGRTCYKSEDKITETSALKFVRKLVQHKHTAMVEMSNFVVRTEIGNLGDDSWSTLLTGAALRELFNIASLKGTYLEYTYDDNLKFFYIGGNLTAWVHALTLPTSADKSYMVPFFEKYSGVFDLCKPHSANNDVKSKFVAITDHKSVPYSLKRLSFKFTCDRGVSHELVRHRPASFAQESTRYVCYMKQKDVAFVKPYWYNEPEMHQERLVLEHALAASEVAYNDLRKLGMTPQAARAVLPNATKTELIMTSTPHHFEHVIKLRTAKDAHPDAQIATTPMIEVLKRYKNAEVA